MKKGIPAIFVALAIAGSMLLATAGVATAVSSPGGGPAGTGPCATLVTTAKGPGATIEGIRAFANCEINRRLATLADLSAKVAASKAMAGSDASALATEIAAEKSGLTALRTRMDSETALLALRADLVRIVTDYRVYVLVVPQVNLTIGSDVVLAAQSRFGQIGTALAARIASAQAAGKDTTAAQSALDAMNASVAAARALVTSLPAKLLALTPAQFNAGTAGPVLNAARTALAHARDDLKAATTDARACLAALR